MTGEFPGQSFKKWQLIFSSQVDTERVIWTYKDLPRKHYSRVMIDASYTRSYLLIVRRVHHGSIRLDQTRNQDNLIP